jgi:hypothetical protein
MTERPPFGATNIPESGGIIAQLPAQPVPQPALYFTAVGLDGQVRTYITILDANGFPILDANGSPILTQLPVLSSEVLSQLD